MTAGKRREDAAGAGALMLWWPLSPVAGGLSAGISPCWTVAAETAAKHGKAGPIEAPRIDVSGAKTLSLRVLPGDDEAPYPIQDEADWLGAMLVK